MLALIAAVRRVLPAMLAASLLLGCAGSGGSPAATPAGKGVVFSDAERSRIAGFYSEARRRPAAAPAPVYKAGDVLPAGVRPQPLPDALKTQLPDPPAGFARLVVGADVILVDRQSHLIADVVPAVAY